MGLGAKGLYAKGKRRIKRREQSKLKIEKLRKKRTITRRAQPRRK